MTGKPSWIALMLKDKYVHDFEKRRIKNDLMHRLGYRDEEIVFTKFDRQISSSYYFFVVDRPGGQDMFDVMQAKSEVFDPYSRPMRLTDDEMRGFIQSCQESVTPKNIKYGDVVYIKSGKYSSLNGIVLRKTPAGLYDVGVKMCFGKDVVQYRAIDLAIVGNIFKYIKVPR